MHLNERNYTRFTFRRESLNLLCIIFLIFCGVLTCHTVNYICLTVQTCSKLLWNYHFRCTLWHHAGVQQCFQYCVWGNISAVNKLFRRKTKFSLLTLWFCLVLGQNWYISLPILLADIGLWQRYWYQRTCSPISADIEIVVKAGKKAWTSCLKCCNHVVCPAGGSPLGQHTDIWNKVCWISCLYNVSLLHVFDKHIKNISCRISAVTSDIGIFLLPSIGIGIGPKNPILVGPFLVLFWHCTTYTHNA